MRKVVWTAVVVLVLAMLGAVQLADRVSGWFGADEAELERQDRNALQAREGWRTRLEEQEEGWQAAKTASAGLRRSVEIGSQRADSAHKRAEEALALLPRLVGAEERGQLLVGVIGDLHVEVAGLRRTLDSAMTGWAMAEAQAEKWRGLSLASDSVGARLQEALLAERQARRCRILFLIPCPSRTAAFVAGGGVVLIVQALLPKKDPQP